MQEEYNGFKVVSDGAFGMKCIKPIGKGSVPLELRGSYTNAWLAKRQIDLYLSSKKVSKGGETE